MKIGIFGHYGNKNLGDEAIILSVIQNVKRKCPTSDIIGFSLKPDDTSSRLGIQAYPIRRIKEGISKNKIKVHTNSDPIIKDENQKTSLVGTIKNRIKKESYIYNCVKIPIQSGRLFITVLQEFVFLKRSYKRLKDVDLLMITGSNQFLDNFGGSWGFPYTLLKWSFLSKVTGTKLVYICIGAGPLERSLSKVFVLWSIFFSKYLSLRDSASKELLVRIGYKGEAHVFPDLAFSLDLDQITKTELPFPKIKNNLPVIGINPMPLYDPRYWHVKDSIKYNIYLSKMIVFSAQLIEKGYPIFFFPTMEKDNGVIEDILLGLEGQRNQKMPYNRYALNSFTVNQLMGNIAAADIVIATRFHATVLSLLTEKPTLGIWYHTKNRDVLEDMGQGDYAVDLDSFSVEALWRTFEDLVANREAAYKIIGERKLRYINALNKQYDLLLE